MTTSKRKKPQRRLEKPIKQYALNQCALHGIQGFGHLEDVLYWEGSRQDLEVLPDQKDVYKVWQHTSGRWIQEANPDLRKLHTRIATLLRRVAPPDYRFSGVPGRCFVDNAQRHLADMPSVKTDIEGFYPSVSFNHVRRFFKEQMNCAGDIAFLLAKLCCYAKKHLPTGGVHSEVLAFYCLKPCFDQIAERVSQRGGVMTVYVDDIMITMPRASHGDLQWLRTLFSKYDLRLHGARKSRVFPRRSGKTITGVYVRNGQTYAPHSQHRAVLEKFTELEDPSLDHSGRVHAARSLVGHLEHIQQIDPRFSKQAIGNRTRLAPLLNDSNA